MSKWDVSRPSTTPPHQLIACRPSDGFRGWLVIATNNLKASNDARGPPTMTGKHLNDGSALEQSWHQALSEALRTFRQLSASQTSSARPWKLVPSTGTASGTPIAAARRREYPFPAGAGRADGLGEPLVSDVVVHKRTSKKGDTFRAVLDVPLLESDREWYDIEVFKGLLQTPETNMSWDNMVEGGDTLDVPDVNTRVCRTRYRLGWPANPRDAITISKTFCDGHSLIWVSTSLPRSPNEPPHLRPAPPYVRAHMAIQAFHIQSVPTAHIDGDATPGASRETLRLTCFWSWDPKGSWMVGGSLPMHLPGVLLGLYRHAKSQESRIPTLSGFGTGVVPSELSLEPKRNLLECRYVVVDDAEEGVAAHSGQPTRPIGSLEGAEALELIKEQRRLSYAIEFALSPAHAWDVQIQVKGSVASSDPQWTPFIGRYLGSASPPRLVLRCTHAHPGSKDDLTRVSIAIERTTGTFGVRINGIAAAIEALEPRSKMTLPLPLSLADTASGLSGLSVGGRSDTTSVLNAVDDALLTRTQSEPAAVATLNSLKRRRSGRVKRTAGDEKQISAMIKRNYIYFTSLLQEPEAKWRPLSESKGVALHQLRSIDSTLNIVRAEAVFVGVGIWDIFAVISNWGAGSFWDPVADDGILLEDLNEFSELWWLKGKGAWSTSGRENVVLRTVYKTAESMHLVSMSVNDKHLFPRLPDAPEGILRLQTDVQGWAIESLSSNTVQLTLIEQRDARSKSSLPQIISAVGEQAIKQGAPPIVTSLLGGKQTFSRFDGETYKLEYEASAPAEAVRPSLRPTDSTTTSVVPLGKESTPSVDEAPSAQSDRIESQVRCDCEIWTGTLEITVDPPPLQVSSLRRHRISGFGGLWITIEHDRATLGQDKVSIVVKRGKPVENSRSKLSLLVNGHRTDIQVEEVDAAELEASKKQKRGKPHRQPLDRPALPALRRRTQVGRKDSHDDGTAQPNGLNVRPVPSPASSGIMSGLSSWAYPFGNLYSVVSEATRSALVPVGSDAPAGTLAPADAAEDALRQVFLINDDRSNETEAEKLWTSAGRQADGFVLEKRLVADTTTTCYRTTGILRGSSAREVLSVVQGGPSGRHKWDERSLGETAVASYGNGIDVRWKVQAAAVLGLPMRSRGFLVAGMSAADTVSSTASGATEQTSFQDRFFVAATSKFDRKTLAETSFNPTQIAEGRVVLEGWIIEDLDPYSPETYDIPSAKVTYISAYDYGGLPAAVNNTLNYNRHSAVLSTMQRLLKAVGPRESVRYPAAGIRLTNDGSEPPTTAGTGVHLLTQRFDSAELTAVTVLIKPDSTFGPAEPAAPPSMHQRSDSQNRFSTWRSQLKSNGDDNRVARSPNRPRLPVARLHLECRGAAVELEIAVESRFAVGGIDAVPSLERGDTDDASSKVPFVAEVVQAPRSLLRTAGAESHIKGFIIHLSIEIESLADSFAASTPKTDIKPFVPAWLASLRAQGCIATLKVRRREADLQANGIRFVWKGSPLLVKNAEDEASAVETPPWPPLDLQRDRSGEKPVPRAILAIASSSLDKAATTETALVKGEGGAIVIADDAQPSATSTALVSRPIRPDLTQVAQDRPSPPRRTSLYSFFAYPSAASSRRATLLSQASEKPATRAPSSSAALEASPPAVVHQEPAPQSVWDIQLPLIAVLCIAAACFLAGSLLRSLLAHSEDYIMFFPVGADTANIDAPADWTEMRKIVQIPMLRWDIVVGIVRAPARQ